MPDIATVPSEHRPSTLGSRAVLRRIEAGSSALCVHCGDQVKFAAKVNRLQVIANVYVDGHWDRVEHFHEECYGAADTPYGDPGALANRASSRSA